MAPLITALATGCTGCALVVFVAGLLRAAREPARLPAAVGLALELLLAGGLLRLSATETPTALAVAFGIVVVRKVAGTGLKLAAQVLRAGAPPRPRG